MPGSPALHTVTTNARYLFVSARALLLHLALHRLGGVYGRLRRCVRRMRLCCARVAQSLQLGIGCALRCLQCVGARLAGGQLGGERRARCGLVLEEKRINCIR